MILSRLQFLPKLARLSKVGSNTLYVLEGRTYHPADLLKLSDETDLDILNSSMETMVEHFQDELLPVAAQLTARLVCTFSLSTRLRS